MSEIRIRFNKKHVDETDVWRVFDNGNEYNVQWLAIEVPVRSSVTFEDGERKWNICCEGELAIVHRTAHIT